MKRYSGQFDKPRPFKHYAKSDPQRKFTNRFNISFNDDFFLDKNPEGLVFRFTVLAPDPATNYLYVESL